ncbi:GNVR domain-containing protein [Candidatus Kuenenia stuttgartensis]|uniref:GNVR domain-containing protein n=1 Tax=Kuenenia stuttgartiensis TaxID=174633 RepID=UPI00146D947F|nr:GNVR domain-containing protein [Candidatus Kuenenia stuttgartiensis]
MFPEIKENKVIDELYKQLCSLKESVLANTKKYGPNHPRMIEANASIKGLEQEIIEEVKKVCSSIKRELDSIIAFESTNPKMQDIQEQMSLVKAGGAINYDILHLEAMSDQAIYDILINQAKEINLTGNMKKDTIRVVDKAEAPLFPSKPRKKLNVPSIGRGRLNIWNRPCIFP